MTHQSEERLPDQASPPSSPASAQILEFPRHGAETQSELQRAVLMRAQEAMERDRDRDREARKVSPLRWIVVSTLALIPVVLMVVAVDGFLRVFHKYNEIAGQSQPAPEASAPIEEAEPDQPGVVILQPYDGQKKEAAAATSSEAANGAAPKDVTAK
jgi:hypothetical protein